MKVIVSNGAVEAAIQQQEFGPLHSLLSHATTGRHLIVFENNEGRAALLATFSDQVRSYYERILDSNMRSFGRYSAGYASVHVVNDESTWDDPIARLPLSETLRLLAEPLGILLENSENDWNFLQGVMRKSECDRLQNFVKEGWAVPIHGGGNTLKAILERRLADNAKALRTFVMFDSDRMHPDEHSADWLPKVEGLPTAICQAIEWERIARGTMPQRYWMLKRRFIESYMPIDEVSAAANQTTSSGAIEIFACLPKETRWYYNMKEGLTGDQRRSDKHRCKDLYGHLSADECTALATGFGNKLASHYRDALARPFNWDADARAEAAEAIPRLIRLL